MSVNDEVVLEYSKKIYGFAYSKTHNYHDAEDLASEIVVQMLSGRIDFNAIENKDAYIYRICCYTWSNFLRKNKRHWDNVASGEIPDFTDNSEKDNEYADEELFCRLRQEVMYLGRTRREIMILHYFDNKKISEIAKILNISESAVKWHMRETKNILKERIEMTETSEIYKPVRLSVGHSGWVKEYGMSGLANDVIMQNICYICSKEALAIEDIARTLGIASFYLEDKIEKLLYMDYIKEVQSGKYVTTFYIQDKDDLMYKAHFYRDNIEKMAVPVLKLSQEALPKIKALKSVEGEFSDDFLLYSIAMLIAKSISGKLCKEINEETKNVPRAIPKRKDGTEHWVNADVSPIMSSLIAEDDREVWENFVSAWGMGAKNRCASNINSLQFDISDFSGWRAFENNELRNLERVIDIIENDESPNDYDKEIISSLCSDGYVTVRGGKPIVLIPYIKNIKEFNEQFEFCNLSLRDIDKKYETELVILKRLIINGNKELKRSFPKNLDKNLPSRILLSHSGFHCPQVIHYLYQTGQLYAPTEEEKKRICTVIYKPMSK